MNKVYDVLPIEVLNLIKETDVRNVYIRDLTIDELQIIYVSYMKIYEETHDKFYVYSKVTELIFL